MPIIASLFKKINGVKTIVYPRTKEKAVYDDEGNRLDEKLKKIKESSENAVSNLSIEVTGSGNAVTDASYGEGKIELKKGSSFLTAHPDTGKTEDTHSSEDPGNGNTFRVVDWIERDEYGHITSIASKDVRMPQESKVNIVNGRSQTVTGSALDAVQANMNVNGTIANYLYGLIKKIDIKTDSQNRYSISYDSTPNRFHVINGTASAYDWISETIENALSITYHTEKAGAQLIIDQTGIYSRQMSNGVWTEWMRSNGMTQSYYRRSDGTSM